MNFKDKARTFIKYFNYTVLGLIVLFALVKCVHYDGPYRGKVVELETGKPIEGAVVAAEWSVEVFVHASPHCDAKETVTDKNGEFELSRGWCINHPFANIENPEIVVFKQGYATANGFTFSSGTPSIFAIGPSTIGYLERSKETIDGQTFEVGSKKTKTYPEGLIFSWKACEERISSLKQFTPFMIDYIFLPLAGARDKIKRLEIPLNCPNYGEPVPHVDPKYNFKNDIETYIKKSYVVVSLPKLKTIEEREFALNEAESLFIHDEALRKLPLLLKLTNEENKSLWGWERPVR